MWKVACLSLKNTVSLTERYRCNSIAEAECTSVSANVPALELRTVAMG